MLRRRRSAGNALGIESDFRQVAAVTAGTAVAVRGREDWVQFHRGAATRARCPVPRAALVQKPGGYKCI